MKVTIQARPGELHTRGDVLLAAVQDLVKGSMDSDEPKELLIPALNEGHARGRAEVERISRVALQKMLEVIG